MFFAEKFVQLSLRTFAEPKELELRMSQILEYVTADLSEGEERRGEEEGRMGWEDAAALL